VDHPISLQLRTHVTHIIHAAWQLNFNLRLEGFERVHVAGVRHLIDLALSSPRAKSPRFLFCSSISTVSFYDRIGSVPEEPFEDESYATLGYGLSKLVGERITAIASEKAGLDAAVVRIGQISSAILLLPLLFILTWHPLVARPAPAPGLDQNTCRSCSAPASDLGWFLKSFRYV
jgi:hypothetical protein